MQAVNRYIITGAPCTGKSTLISSLKSEGFPVFDEVARKVIAEQLEKRSSKVPWLDNIGFSELVITQQQKDYNSASSPINFYDRGIPDVLAYIKHFNTKKEWLKFEPIVKQHSYTPTLFLLPPWKEIYQNDKERLESFDDALKIHHALVETYSYFNYKIIEVPLASNKERLNFILKHI